MKEPSLDVNAKDEETMTALHWAAAYDETKVVEALLGNPRVEPNSQNKRKNTPLHQAAMYGTQHTRSDIIR